MEFLTANSGSIFAVVVAIVAIAFNFLGKKKAEAEQKAENVGLQVANAKLEEHTTILVAQEQAVQELIKENSEPVAVPDLTPSEAVEYWNKRK